jgi:hypothetical protein
MDREMVTDRAEGVERILVDDSRSASDAPPGYSSLGIASFLVALLVGGMDVILILLTAVNVASSRDGFELRSLAFSGGMGFVCLNVMSIPLCLVGSGMGAVAIFTQRDKNHVFSWIGLLVNTIVIASVLGLMVASAFARHP